MQHFENVIRNLYCLRFSVCMCLRCVRVFVCVHELLCVCVCVCVCVCLDVCYVGMCLPVCVAVARHDPCSLGDKPLETRDPVPYMYDVEHGHYCDLLIV